MFHEILHLDLAADSANYSPNPKVDDLTISIKVEGEYFELWHTDP